MATINDVAKMAGVSAATVSHVVNKTRYVSPELAKRVEDAIKELEFPPNFVVKKSKTTNVTSSQKYILLLASDIHNSFQLEVEKVIQNNLKEEGYSLISVDYSGDDSKLELYFQLLMTTQNICGVVAFPDVDDSALKKVLSITQAPIIIVGKTISGIDADLVLSDNFGGAYKATTHLIRSGHENIAIICGRKDSESNIDRINGYKKALGDNKIPINTQFIITDLLNDTMIFDALNNLLLDKNPPTAIFAANYQTILSMFKFISKNNIKCPEDLSIIGFNDFEWAPLHNPPITTVAQDTDKIANEVSKLLLKRIRAIEHGQDYVLKIDPNDEKQKIVADTQLLVRGSTRGIGRGPFGEKAVGAELISLSNSDKQVVSSGNFTAAISFHYTGKSWMNLHEQGLKNVFNSLGISLLAVTDAHFDPVMQNKQLEGLLALEPSVIISIPTDNVKTAPSFKKIAKSKTELVLITNVPKGLTPNDYITCVSVNERSHGRCAGRGLGDYMKKNNKTNIGLIKHSAEFYATNQRDNAAEQILIEEYPELNICGSVVFENEDNVYEKTIELLTKHPEIQGLYISWEGPTTKALSALSEMNRLDVAIATCDLEYSIALNMAKGGAVKVISAQCPYEQGQAMAIAAANALIGKHVPSFIGVEPLFVTSDNLLKSWEKVFKEPAPQQIVEALKSNPNYVSIN